MKITAEQIVQNSKLMFEDVSFVNAFWLEGSHALGTSDKYSDLDLWFDVEDHYILDFIKLFEGMLFDLGEIDFQQIIDNDHPLIMHIMYHLKNSDKNLLLDVCIQKSSRDVNESRFEIGNKIECPKVIFEKKKTLIFEEKLQIDMAGLRTFYDKNVSIIRQSQRAFKYYERGTYIESVVYYEKYVRDVIINLCRILYTPLYYDYAAIHFSVHFPSSVVEKVEELFKYNSIEDLMLCSQKSLVLFQELDAQIKEKYNF